MLKFTNQPYVFREAKPHRVIYRFATWMNRFVDLPGRRHQIKSLDIQGGERIKKYQFDPNVRLVFVANHSTHSDVEVLTEAQRRCGVWGAYMAAHEVFIRSKMQAWVMQRMGAFSINRESLDRPSIKEGVKVIKGQRCSLSLFPEGNVSFTNEQVGVFLDGASFMAIKAQKELGCDVTVMMVPVSIRITHKKDVRVGLVQQLSQLVEGLTAEGIELEINHHHSLAHQIERVGHAILCRGLRMRGLCVPEPLKNWQDDGEKLEGHLDDVEGSILQQLEEEMGLVSKGNSTDRTRSVRFQLAKMRGKQVEVQDQKNLSRWDDLSMFLLRMETYDVSYLRTCPSIDRCSESLEKLREDFEDVLVRPISPRHAHLQFGEPIPVRGWKVSELTEELEVHVNQGLSDYRSPHIGGEGIS